MGKINTKPRQTPEGSQLLTFQWKFLENLGFALILSPRKKLGGNGLSEVGIPSWKKGSLQESKFPLLGVLPSGNDERFEEIKLEIPENLGLRSAVLP